MQRFIIGQSAKSKWLLIFSPKWDIFIKPSSCNAQETFWKRKQKGWEPEDVEGWHEVLSSAHDMAIAPMNSQCVGYLCKVM